MIYPVWTDSPPSPLLRHCEVCRTSQIAVTG